MDNKFSQRLSEMLRIIKILLLTAGGLLLSGFLFVAIYLMWPESNQSIFIYYYQTEMPNPYRWVNATESPLEPGFKAIESGNFQVAEAFFQTIDSFSVNYAEAQYYLGHTALQLQHFDLAVSAFQRAAQHQEKNFQQKAAWNLLLVYVAAGQTETVDFKTKLEAMVQHGGRRYQEFARQLKKRLENRARKFRL